MIRKSISELHFIEATAPMPTVEFDVDSLPEGVSGYSDLVESALIRLAAATQDLKATVYVLEGPSVSFGGYGHSAFFAAVGSKLVLPALYDSLCNISGLKIRHSEPIRPSQTQRQYHIERGLLWSPENEQMWCADGEEAPLCSAETSKAEGGTLGNAMDSNSAPSSGKNRPPSDSGEAAESSGVRTQLPTRFRAARSDASVGSIIQNIEQVYGLPEGSIALRGPDKKALRSDATIRTLRKRWD